MAMTKPDDQDFTAIDVGPAFAGDPDARQATAALISDACEDIGFLILENHGMTRELLDRYFTETRAFYDLPQDQKDRFHPTGPAKQRGYHGYETRGLAYTMDEAAPRDLRESVFLGPVDDHRDYFAHIPEATTAYAPNIIPDRPGKLDQTLIEVYRSFEQTAANLLELFALALELPETYFADKIDRHFSIMGCHHYPPLPKPPLPGQLRTGAHTDFGAMTLLAVDDAPGGYEAQFEDGRWVPVFPRPGQLVVNLGDMMERWTNDRWHSTMHRVVNPPNIGGADTRRQSLGYFMHPNFDTEVACISSCLAPGEKPKYPTITAGEHIALKIAKSHNGAKSE